MTSTAPSADVQAIRTLLQTYEDTLNASDAATAASLYTTDGVFFPLFLPTAIGDKLQERYRQIFNTIKLEVAFTIDEVTIAGDTAYALTRSAGHVADLTTGRRDSEANRELFVFKRDSGHWLIARYMFNKISLPS